MGTFETIDITHHPKRTQAGNVAKAGTAYANSVSPKTKEGSVPAVLSSSEVAEILNIPENVTMESAIKFFRGHATGQFATLFTMTADWLEKYRLVSRATVNKAIQQAGEQENNDDVLTVDMSKVGE